MRTLLSQQTTVFFIPRRSYSFFTSTANPPPYRVLFCGTDKFAKTALTTLHDVKDVCSSLHVLTARDAPNTWQSKKRVSVSPVKEWARDAGLPYDTVPAEGIASYQLPAPFEEKASDTLLVTASFGHLIPSSILSRFPASQRLNLHPSLLPQLSGAAPIQWAIARQMKSTGVSVQSLGEKFDSGHIYAQEEMPIPPGSTYESLEETLSQHGSQLLLKVLRNLPNLSANAWPQSQAPAHLVLSKAPKLSRSHSDIRWNDWTSNEIVARHNGFGYLYPMTTSLTDSNKVLLRQIRVVEDFDTLSSSSTALRSSPPGTAMFSPSIESLIVKCKEGYLDIKSLQSIGKRQMTAAQWIIGYRHYSDPQGFLFFQ